MKRIYVLAFANQPLRLLGLITLLLCVAMPAVTLASADNRNPNLPDGRAALDRTLPYPAHGYVPASYAPQQKQNRHARAFVLEGIYARNEERYRSKLPVEVYRNGKKLELLPGDELQEGDRVHSLISTREAVLSGAYVAIYNDDGEPVLIVGHPMGVDFTLSKLGFDRNNFRAPRVEIINHFRTPPAVEMQIADQDSHGGEVVIHKEDGTQERSLTPEENNYIEQQMRLEDNPFRREARWTRAKRIIEEGRKGAEQEYDDAESEIKQEDEGESRRLAGEIAKQKDQQQERESEQQEKESIPNVIHESEGGFQGTWTRQGNTFEAVWDNGAKATLTIEKFDNDQVVIKRDDTGASVSHNFKATYTGRLSGNSIVDGKVAYEQNGNKWDGTWSARW